MSLITAPPGSFRSIPVLLVNGYHANSILYLDSNEHVQSTSWARENGVDVFGIKIGGADSPSRGTPVGERYSRQILQQLIQAGKTPLPVNYQVTDADDFLMMSVAVDGKAAWDVMVAPVAVANGISVDPGPVPPNSSPGAPGVAPTPAPAPPPPPPLPPAPLPSQGTSAPIADQTIRAALEARYPGKGDAYANALNDLDGLGSAPNPGKLLADLLPLFGSSLGVFEPLVAAMLTMALTTGSK